MKICFVLPSLLKKTSPITGISIIINYLSKKYDVSVIGILDFKKPNSNYFGKAEIIVPSQKNLIKIIPILNNINADIYISSLFQSDILTSFVRQKKISLIRSDLLKSYIFDKGNLLGYLM